MRVVVKLFAGLREQAGTGELEIEVGSGASVAQVWAQLGLGAEPAGLLYAVNREYAEREQELADGDEVALIPPVSGGAFRLSEEPLDLAAAVAEVADERAGAIATFVGTTRIESRGREVHHLDYEAYGGMAESVMERITADLQDKYDLCAVSIHHRIGQVEIGHQRGQLVSAQLSLVLCPLDDLPDIRLLNHRHFLVPLPLQSDGHGYRSRPSLA